jgi:hypothetical protein
MGLPGGAPQREGVHRQGNVPVFGALAPLALDLEASAIHVGALKIQGCMEPETQAGDGGAGALVGHGGRGRQEPPDLRHTEAGREPVGRLRAQEREGVPVALEDVLREEANTAGADTHGGWGEAIDVFAVQERALQLLCGDAVGGWVGELGQQADCAARGFLRPLACAAEVESRDHVLT